MIDARRCDQCYFVERTPAGVHPMLCQREKPSVRCSDARSTGGVCDGGRNFLQNKRKVEYDEPLD